MDTPTDTNSTNAPSISSSKFHQLAQKLGSDGCTSAPDLNVRNCCEEHDVHYALADIPRSEADKKLRHCMKERGWRVLPWVYWAAVRIFGKKYYQDK